MNKRTPGPWSMRVWGDEDDPWPDRRVSVGPQNARQATAVLISPQHADEGQAIRDATLAAAAPDMLEALNQCPQRVDYTTAEDHSQAVEDWAAEQIEPLLEMNQKPDLGDDANPQL